MIETLVVCLVAVLGLVGYLLATVRTKDEQLRALEQQLTKASEHQLALVSKVLSKEDKADKAISLALKEIGNAYATMVYGPGGETKATGIVIPPPPLANGDEPRGFLPLHELEELQRQEQEAMVGLQGGFRPENGNYPQ